jgi:hypothetical protein
LLLLLLILSFAPSLWFAGKELTESRLRRDLRTLGARADVVRADGECFSSRSRLTNTRRDRGCNLVLTYRAAEDKVDTVRTASVRLEGTPPYGVPGALYDPADPSRIMIDTEVSRDVSINDVAGPIVLLVFPVLLTVVFVVTSRKGIARAAQRPEPVLVPIARIVRRQGQLDVFFVDPERKREAVDSFDAPGPLLVAGPEGKPLGLALKGARRPHLLDARLVLLDLTDAERASVLAAAR